MFAKFFGLCSDFRVVAADSLPNDAPGGQQDRTKSEELRADPTYTSSCNPPARYGQATRLATWRPPQLYVPASRPRAGIPGSVLGRFWP